MAKLLWAAFLKIRNDEIDLGRLPRFAERRKLLRRGFRIVRKVEHRRDEVSAWRGSVNIVRAAFRMARNGAIVPASVPHSAEDCNRRGEVSAWCGTVTSFVAFRMVRKRRRHDKSSAQMARAFIMASFHWKLAYLMHILTALRMCVKSQSKVETFSLTF